MRIVFASALVASLFALAGCGPELYCGKWLTYDNCADLEQEIGRASNAQQRNDLEQCFETHCEGAAGGEQEEAAEG